LRGASAGDCFFSQPPPPAYPPGFLPLWEKDSPEALYVRKLGRRPDETFETYRAFFEDRPAATLANIAICLIHQANYLLNQQIRRLEKDFVEKGGIRERMTAARMDYRKKQAHQTPPG
jgi:four helix bundle suffix protein